MLSPTTSPVFSQEALTDLNSLLAQWHDTETGTKAAFEAFRDHLQAMDGIRMQFKSRPGVSHSLRASHPAQSERELFVLVDVVDDDPDARWLSVCFYADMVTDPAELGDWVPGGLLGEDALCLNLENDDEDMRAYIIKRLTEAYTAAKG